MSIGIYQMKPGTDTTNLYLRTCGEALQKIASENSVLAEEHVVLSEKIASLEKELQAYKDASALAASGQLDGRRVRAKVAELMGTLHNQSNIPATSSRTFSEKVSSVKSNESPSTRAFLAALRAI